MNRGTDCLICDTDRTICDTDLLMDAEASAYTYGSMERVKEVKGVLEVLNDMGIAKFELTGEKIVVANK